jgi:tetratricopeptide (TPR) repeat protein
MKTFLLSAGLALAMSATASANPTFPNAPINSGLTAVQSPLQVSLNECLSTESSSRAIRACSKSLRAAAPNDDVRSQLYTRRALHQLALGRHDDAAKDFSRAGNLSSDRAIESLGHGFAAMMDNDLATARRKFEDCNNQGSIAPLAEYGLGLTHQMAGETDAAREAYTRALNLRPGWVAVSEQMATLTVK